MSGRRATPDGSTGRLPSRIERGEVVLDRLGVEHAGPLAEAVRRSYEHLEDWMPWLADGVSEAHQRNRAITMDDRWERGLEFHYVIREGRLTGRIDGVISAFAQRNDCFEIGYWVCADRTRRGIASAALGAVHEESCSLDGVDATELFVDENNAASQALAVSCGYLPVGTTRRTPLARGESGTLIHYMRSCDAVFPLPRPVEESGN